MQENEHQINFKKQIEIVEAKIFIAIKKLSLTKNSFQPPKFFLHSFVQKNSYRFSVRNTERIIFFIFILINEKLCREGK